MTIVLILAPYGAFPFLMLVATSAASRFAAAAISLAVITYDFADDRSVKILGAGAVLVFSAVYFYVEWIDPSLSMSGVKFAVDAVMFLITLGSIGIGKPFTLQYALEVVDAETAKLPGFIRANYTIACAWVFAMLLMMAGNVALI